MSCLIPWDFAPGLSFPYPSNRLITPHTASPAPIATTSVCKILIAWLKNAIFVVSFQISVFLWFLSLRSLFRLCPYGRPFMISQIHHLPKGQRKKSYVSESFTCSASLFSVFNSFARLSSENSYRSNSCVLVSFTSIRCRIYASTSNSFFLS